MKSSFFLWGDAFYLSLRRIQLVGLIIANPVLDTLKDVIFSGLAGLSSSTLIFFTNKKISTFLMQE
jgi:hypothetical protein